MIDHRDNREQGDVICCYDAATIAKSNKLLLQETSVPRANHTRSRNPQGHRPEARAGRLGGAGQKAPESASLPGRSRAGDGYRHRSSGLHAVCRRRCLRHHRGETGGRRPRWCGHSIQTLCQLKRKICRARRR